MRKASVREGEPGWFASLLGAAILIAGGFALGLVAGVVSEEPELVVGHLVGRSEEVAWLPERRPEFTPAGAEGAVLGAEAVPEAIALEDVDGVGEPQPSPPAVATAPPVSVAPPGRRTTRNLRDIDSIPTGAPPPVIRLGFSVQVGAFADGGAAEDVRQKLRSKGFDTYLIPANESGDGKWRVRVGPVHNKGAAEKLASRLKTEERLPTWVLAEGGG